MLGRCAWVLGEPPSPWSCLEFHCRHAVPAFISPQRVEAGAQGEHKISRGYLPHLTYSSHYIPDPGFRHMVERFLQQERAEIAYALHMLRQEASPYKHNPVSS